MRYDSPLFFSRFLKTFEWHRWFAWHPIRVPDGWQWEWLWLETVERKRVEVGPQGLTGNYEWRYRMPSQSAALDEGKK